MAKEYKSLTEQDIKDVIEKIFNENVNKEEEREIVLGRYCTDKGWVISSGIDLNMCNNPNCSSCRLLDDLIKKEVENWPFKLSK